jgi:hypothetical protein
VSDSNKLSNQERQLIELLREGPANKDPRFDEFRIEVSHQTGVWTVVTGGNCGIGEPGIGPTFAAAWDNMMNGSETED